MPDSLSSDRSLPVRHYQDHARSWRTNVYVYPVVSRRSEGVSVGVNLNPDQACNFDCIYCQVDRTAPPAVRHVDLAVLKEELTHMLEAIRSGALFQEPEFRSLPEPLRVLKDIAFSGDGEPTTCKIFAQCVQAVVDVKHAMGLEKTRIVLITDAAYLTRPAVEAGLEVMDRHCGVIWAKLDAGTEAYYRQVNRPNVPLDVILDNILAAARKRPVIIQTLFMRINSLGPDPEEISAYINRLRHLVDSGGRIARVQVYTVARKPAQDYVTPLSDAQVDEIAERVRNETELDVRAYYGPSDF